MILRRRTMKKIVTVAYFSGLLSALAGATLAWYLKR